MLKNIFFTLMLTFSIYAERVAWISFEVGFILGAIKYIICRDVDKRHIQLGACHSDIFCTDRIDEMCPLSFFLSQIDFGIGGTVNDRARFVVMDSVFNGFKAGDIAIFFGQREGRG